MSTPSKAARHSPRAPRTIAGALLAAADAELDAAGRVAWPSPRWRSDPVGFAREVLGIELTDQQRSIAEAVRDSPRVAVRAGQKLGKSECAGTLALWFFCTYPDARVVFTAPTSRQVDVVLWRAIRRLHSRAIIPIGGEPAELARTGLRMGAPDFRELAGFAAKEAEAVAGLSGARVFYIVDEASGVDDAIFDAIEGNLAAGGDCRLLLLSNPTRPFGRFAECFRERIESWHTIHLSALDSPNVRAGRVVVPGMASPAWIRERREEWGEDSAFYQVRVLGEFVRNEAGRCFPMALIAESQQRWPDAPEEGALSIGVDPAGEGGDADETAFCVVRGSKVLALYAFRGLSRDGIWEHLRGLLHTHRRPGETPRVVLDAGGAVGEPLATKLAGIANVAQGDHGFKLQCVRANKKASRPEQYAYVRDELHASLSAWLRDGGAIPADLKLERELSAPAWETTDRASRVTPKDELRKVLGRSPDRCDALMLAVFPVAHVWGYAQPVPEVTNPDPLGPGGAFDPYSAVAGFQYEGGAFDPYAATR